MCDVKDLYEFYAIQSLRIAHGDVKDFYEFYAIKVSA